jgi:hypothetical protein
VIDDDHVHTERAQVGDLVVRVGAAVERDEQSGFP